MRTRMLIFFCCALGFGTALFLDLRGQEGPAAKPATAQPAADNANDLHERKQQSLPPPTHEMVEEAHPAAPHRARMPAAPESMPQSVFSAESADGREGLENLRRESEQRAKEHIAAVAASFGREIRDQRWSTDMGEALRNTLATEELASANVQAIDCRTKTCRVELQDDGTGRMQALVPMLAVQMAESLPNLTAEQVPGPNGTMATVLYLSR
jgi:hypothetical protein